MDNIVNYAETCLETFEQKPFGPVDSLVLSWLSYLHYPAALRRVHSWQGVRLAELFRAEYFAELFHGVWDAADTRRLFTALAASPRYRDMRVMRAVEQSDPVQEKQFAAATFRLTPELCYLAFRGTDSTLIGWKEDFNMAFKCPVASQEAAVLYVNEAAEHCPGKLLLGGHSKGGNLAVYSAAGCRPTVRARLQRVYSHDGPGFLREVLDSPAFRQIAPLTDKTVPQSSLVGMLLEQQENFRVIRSNRVSFWQHDPFSWEVEGDHFHPIDQLTADARYLDQTLNDWILQMSEEDRAHLVDVLFGVLDELNTGDARTFAQLTANLQKDAVLRAAAGLDDETRNFLGSLLKELAAMSLRNFPEIFKKDDVN